MTSLVNNLGGTEGFGEFSLDRNDDDSTPFIDLSSIFGTQGLNFFGHQYTGLWLNNNGSVTFNDALGAFTPTAITGTTNNPIIAAYWADVDTNGGPVTPTPGGTSAGSDLLWYDLDPITHTFTATWDDVGYFGSHTDHLNAFQLSITQVGVNGDFDIVFRYENVDWTTGDASGGSDGLGGTPARAGYSAGDGVDFFELPQSGDQAALLDLENASNVRTPGTFVFAVRNGSPTPAFSVSDASVVEGSGRGTTVLRFVVSLTAAVDGPVSVDYATSDGTAHAGSDYTATSGTLVIPAGSLSAVIDVPISRDTLVEGDETVTLTLSNQSEGTTILDGTATGTIVNDDASISIAALDADKAEGNGGGTSFTFTVTRTGDTSSPSSANWAVSGPTVNGVDFQGGVLPSGTVTLGIGETSKVITIHVAGDTAVEVDEAFTITLSDPTSGTVIGTASATGVIRNDDGGPPQLSIAATSANKAEGNSSNTAFTFTVTRSGDTGSAVSASWAVSGLAVNAADFAAGVLPSGTVSFAAGETSKVITINVAGDTIVEGNEGFRVTLSNPSASAVIGTAVAQGVIRNDDASLSIAATSANKAEGQSGSTAFTFTVTRTGDLSGTSTAHWAVGGASVNGADFVGGALPSGTLSFGAGETTKVITVNVAGDTVVEGHEPFAVTLSDPSPGTTFGVGTTFGLIRNDDATLLIAASSANKDEGQSGSTPFTFTVTRAGDTTSAVSADWMVTGAVDAADFVGGVLPSGTVSFAAGETTKVITLDVRGDRTVEANEAFTVTLSNPSSGVVVGVASAHGVVHNDDASLSIAATHADRPEGNSGSTAFTFTVTRSGDLTGPASAHWAVSGAAVDAADFVGGTLPSGTVSFVAGQATKVITVNVAGDAVFEADEAFTVTLSNPSAGVVLGTASAHGVIRNDDAGTPTLSITADSANKAEGNSGSTAFTFTVTRTGDTSGASSAHWAVGGSAVNAADFAGGVLPSGTVSFAAGEATKTITLSIAGDKRVEGNEAFTVTLSSPSEGTVIGTASAGGVIRNDDASLSIAASGADKAEGDEGTTAFTFTVTRSGYNTSAVSVHWAVSGAAVDAVDFLGGVLPSGTVSFAAGETSKIITIDIAGDTLVETDEAFTVTLSSPSTGAVIGTASAQGVIRNDDIAPPSLSIVATSADKAEGNTGATIFTFTVTRDGDASSVSSVAWAVSGPDVTGADFVGGTLPSGAVIFSGGETTKTITVSVAGDTLVEADETFAVTLSNPSTGTVIGTATAQGVIRTDDASLSIAAASADKPEGNSGSTSFTFTVTRCGDTSSAASAHWAVSGAAVDGADFVGGVLPSGIVSFAAGQKTQVITIDVAGDTLVEGSQAFIVTLSNPSAGAVIGTATAQGVIRNDDARLSIAATSANKAEGNSGGTPFTFTVTRTGDTSSVVSAHWVVAGVAVDAADFLGGVLPSGTVSFAAGETAKTITINVNGDTAVELDEAFTVTLFNPSAGAVIGTASAQGVIRNDDVVPPSLSIAASSADSAEGNSGSTAFTFTVTRTGDLSGASSAHWAVSGGSANAADFAGGVLPFGTVSFAAGQATSTITINVRGDILVEGNESFIVGLSSPSAGTTIGTGSATGTIRNDDASLSIAASSANRAEGNSGSTAFTFTVTRTGDLSDAASAHWAVSGGSANAADFAGGVLPSGTVSFIAGQATSTVTINVRGDTLIEGNESFVVALSNPSAGTTIGTGSATGTIRNDDASLSIAALSADKSEGDVGATAFTFTVTRSGDTSSAVTADWSVGGSGVIDSDFLPSEDLVPFAGSYSALASSFPNLSLFDGQMPSGTVSFAAGETSKVVTVWVLGETVAEGNESFTITLSDASAGASIGTASAVGIIRNDDSTNATTTSLAAAGDSFASFIASAGGSTDGALHSTNVGHSLLGSNTAVPLFDLGASRTS